MKKRLKIILTAIAMCVIIGTGAYGVYALSTVSVTYNTSIGFNAAIAQIALKASVTGNEGTAIADCYYDPMNHYTSSEKTGATILSSLDSPWNIGNLAFSSNREDIVITVSLTNLSNEEISSYVTTTSTLTNVSVDYTQAMNIATDATKDAVVTISLDTLNSFSGLTLNFTMDIYDNATGGQTFHADPDFLAPNTLSGLTYSSSGSTRTWSNGSTQVFRVVSSTSGTTVTETNTYTAGGKTTTFTTTYATSSAATLSASTLSINNYPIYDRTLTSISGTIKDCYIIPDWMNITTIGRGGTTSTNSVISSTYRANVKKLVLPSTITAISNYAFYGFSRLESVDMPSSLESIGNSAFQGCRQLTSIVIPENVSSIGVYAFSSCYSLAEVYNLSTLPISLSASTYGNVAYYASAIITSADELSRIEKSGDISYYIYGNEKIAVGSTHGASVTELEFDEDTTGIKKYAFYNYTSLSSVSFPTSLTEIETYAFYGCGSLTSITIPANVSTIGSSAFSGCYSLAEVYDLSPRLTISSVSTSNGYVGYYSVAIHTSSVPSRIFESNGMNYYIDGSEKIAVGPASLSPTSITLENGTTEIKKYAFYNRTSLSSITVPSGVTSLGNYAFYGCRNLTSILLPSSVKTIGSYCFQSCSNLASVSIPGVTSLGSSAFRSCTDLSSISLPSSLTSIPSYAFYGCSSLTSIVINTGIRSIGTSAFQNCTNLATVNISSQTVLNGITSKTAMGYLVNEAEIVNVFWNLNTSSATYLTNTANFPYFRQGNLFNFWSVFSKHRI